MPNEVDKGGIPWARARDIEKLNAVGVSKVTRNIGAGSEIKSFARAVGDYMQTELHIRQMLGVDQALTTSVLSTPSSSSRAISSSKSSRERPEAIFWGVNDACDQRGSFRDVPSPPYSDELNALIQHLRHWRGCIVIGPCSAQSCGLDPRFDETMDK